ncbi:MAG: TSUP family transporter [Candidatus Delongbacteria bacterium]|nr:TSUP family transporter [Candidatus Delongbacteria bacterium]MCG2760460.1 TSUP family transporter [Candidatus Delongbacteria bacterium]
MELSVLTYILLFIAGTAAGFIDSIAGGGGLITVPVLLLAGLPPQMALGTNKFQSTFGSITSSYNYVKNGKADLRIALRGIIFTFIGASIGTVAVQFTSNDFLMKLIPFLLTGVLIYLLVSPKAGEIEREKRMSAKWFYMIFGLAIGFYDGYFGPGTGAFWVILIVFFLGQEMVSATAYTKVMNVTSNITALLFFVIGEKVLFLPGLAMGIGEVLGAKIGSGLVIKNGVKFIKPFFYTIVVIIIISLFYKHY